MSRVESIFFIWSSLALGFGYKASTKNFIYTLPSDENRRRFRQSLMRHRLPSTHPYRSSTQYTACCAVKRAPLSALVTLAHIVVMARIVSGSNGDDPGLGNIRARVQCTVSFCFFDDPMALSRKRSRMD